MTEGKQRDVESYVVYRSPEGEKFHRRAECATQANVPAQLDGATYLLSRLEMYRVRELDKSHTDYCDTCAEIVSNHVKMENQR